MRSTSKWALIGVLAMSGSVLIAKDSPTTKPAKLTKPWSEMTSLSADQESQIEDIHQKADAEIRAINKKEHDDIMALLSDDQKTEVAAIETKDRAARGKHHKAAPTSQPAE